jgi:hypothetical protein
MSTVNSLEISGYLSEEISLWIKKHREKYSEWFTLCENINELSHSTMFTFNVHNEYLPELIVATIYVRAMSNFQGAIIMTERGMINEAKSLLRCLLECMFAIVAIEKDKNISNQFTFDDLLERRNFMRAYKRNKGKGIPQHEDAPSFKEIDNHLQNIEKQIKINKVKKLKKRDLAEKAGLETIYDSLYKYLSGTIHVNVRDIEQYLKLDDNGKIKEILWGPDVQEIDFALLTAAETMLRIITAASNLFELPNNKSVQPILEQYDILSKKFNEQCSNK